MKKVFGRLVIAVLVAIPVFAFTNCSEPYVKEKEDLATLAKKAKFAYDGYFDQVAYMSCSELTSKSYDQSTYFTFRAGAYTSGGLKIKDGYIDELSKEYRNPDVRMEYLAASPINTKTAPQLSIRSRANFQQPFAQTGSPELGEDIANFLGELGKPDMWKFLIDYPMGQRVRYMRNGSPEGARFEGTLHLGDSVSLAESVRNVLTGDGMLALTFSGSDQTPGLARSPADIDSTADARQSVFGRGLVISFRQPTPPTGVLYGQYPNYVIREISEINLQDRNDRTDIKPWTCPVSMQFRIVRPGDQAGPCQTNPDPAVLSDDLKRVRRSLRVEDWYVDMANRCIVPKKYKGRDCYGDRQTIQYNMSAQCTPGTNNQDCVHWASICLRQP